jgi:hypothetical protein
LTELIDGHLDVAAVYLRESYGLQEQHLHHRRAIETSIRLAEVLRLQGDTMAAEALYHAVLAFKHPQIGLWLWAAAYLGLAHLHGNDQSRRSGYHYLAESLIRWRAIMSREGIARSLETIARTFESDPIRAARFWGAAEALREQIGAFMWPIDRPEYVRCVAEAQAQVDAVEWAAAWAAGCALTWEQAADQALAWLKCYAHDDLELQKER